MTTQTTAVGADGYTGTALTGLTASILYQIDSGLVDQALRVVFDAIVDRKKLLDAAGNLPQQITRKDVDSAPMEWGPLGQVLTADSNEDTGLYWKAPEPQKMPTAKPVRRARKQEPRPDPNIAPFKGWINPLTTEQQRSTDSSKMVQLNGLTYNKDDIIGKYVHLDFPNHPGLTFKITGVGPKTLKALVVHEPNPGDRLQGKDVWKAWNTNTPMFLPHRAIAQWLNDPATNNHNI